MARYCGGTVFRGPVLGVFAVNRKNGRNDDNTLLGGHGIRGPGIRGVL